MTNFELVVSILAGVSLVGVIVLKALGVSVNELLPICASLIAFVLGMKKDAIVAGLFGK